MLNSSLKRTSFILINCCVMKAFAFSHKSTSSQPNHYKEIYDLQRQHPDESPSDRLEKLAHLISSSSTTEDEAGPSSFFDEEINVFDAYGDYTLSPEESKLRQFESEIAQTFGKEDAVFMPSGVMAQSIALLIHSSSSTSESSKSRDDMPIFACHSSSHLLLHEEKSYHYLLNMKPLIIPDTSKTTTKTTTSLDLYGVPPMTFQDVQETISSFLSSSQTQDNRNSISTLILELPHRELGGKLTPLEDIEKISKFLHSHNIKFHCDGARIFEAHAAYNYHQGGGEEVLSLQDLSSHFDSIYVSFYKGLGGLTGACLLGDKDFCDEARTWLTRMGGNLYTKLPYYASAWVGFRQNHVYHRRDNKKRNEDGKQTKYLSFLDRTIQMRKVIQTISSIPNLQNYIAFEPAVSEANMNHLYLKKEINIDGQKKKLTLEDYIEAREHVLSMHGIHIFPRVRPVEQTEEEESDFVGKIEYTIGNVNGNIPIDVWEKGWTLAIDYLYSKYV